MKNCFSYAIIFLLFVSCAKTDEDVFLDTESVEQNDLKQQIISTLGYTEEEILFDEVDGQVFVQIQEDMLFSIDQIKELITLNTSYAQKQRAITCDEGVLCVYCRTTTCRKRRDYNEQYQSLVWVYIESNTPSEWREAMEEAIEEWNNVSNGLQFFYAGNCTTGDRRYNTGVFLEFENRPEEDRTLARAIIGSKTNFKRIFVNRSFHDYNGLTQNRRVFTLAHELGHTIGYTHIENTANGDCFIEGTEENDRNSLMRTYENDGRVDRNNLFTPSDIVAHLTLYPHKLDNNFKYNVSYKGVRNSRCY